MKKKLLSVCFALALMIGLLPSQAFAIDADDPQLESFLESIDWELQDYEDYLADFDLGLDDFDDPAYLGTPLTEEGYDFGSIEELEELFNLYEDSINNYTTLFEIENATEIYVAMEDGSGLDDEMWEENDDVSEDDDLWEDNTDLSLDMLDTSILSDEPIFDIYAMITVMFLEATFFLHKITFFHEVRLNLCGRRFHIILYKTLIF